MTDRDWYALRCVARAISRAEWLRVAEERGFRVGETERLFRKWWDAAIFPAPTIIATSGRRHINLSPFIAAKRAAMAAGEKLHLEQVMRNANGVVTHAARAAGVDRTNFRRLLQRHGIDPAAFRDTGCGQPRETR